jgi:N-methylhydantoinase A
MSVNRLLLGIDVGGTFTDAVAFDRVQGRLISALKVTSTPDDPGRAVVEAIDKLSASLDIRGAAVCHGTTVGTNTLIERRGARTALIATQGFKDVIELRRQARPMLYGFDIQISEPLVGRDLRFEADERVAADGTVVRPLSNTTDLIEKLRAAGVEAVAVSLLNAYCNAAHEKSILEAIEEALPELFVTRSSDVCPEFREYERTSTAVVNAYIGPAVSHYVSKLDATLRDRGISRLLVVKSNGGLTSPENAALYPVHLVESGPAAALTATASYARALGRPDLIAFDMGGTTAKAGVIRNGSPETSSEFFADRLVEGRDVGGYAIRSAVLDLVEIGAGGGSIAWIDEAGVLKVGPRSAGADPGPACYGRGGKLPTVTDAHAVIGTLAPEVFSELGIMFDRARAAEAIRSHIGEPMNWSLARAAYSIIDIAVANMAEMVRLATIRRGLDPRSFAILASGGAGPLHAAAVGAEVGVRDVIVPPHPGMFSALGATLGGVRHEASVTVLRPLEDLKESDLVQGFAALEGRIADLMAAEPPGEKEPPPERVIDARFQGQLFELCVPVGCSGEGFPAMPEIETAFRQLYLAEYGFDLPDARVQVVNLRTIAVRDLGSQANALFDDLPRDVVAAKPARQTTLLARDGGQLHVPLLIVADSAGARVEGPAVLEHSGSTVWLHEGQTAIVGNNGQVLISLSGRFLDDRFADHH